MTFSGIPYGTAYEIEEPNAEADGYSVEKTGEAGVIRHEDSEAKFVNAKNGGISTSADSRTPFAAAAAVLGFASLLLILFRRRRRFPDRN